LGRQASCLSFALRITGLTSCQALAAPCPRLTHNTSCLFSQTKSRPEGRSYIWNLL